MPEIVIKKSRIRPEVAKRKREIRRLVVEEGLLDYEIAERMNLGNETVRIHRREMGLKDNYRHGAKRQSEDGHDIPTGELIARLPASEPTPLEKAVITLGMRARINIKLCGEIVHYLDGRITSSCAIIDEANAIRFSRGEKLIGRKGYELFKPRLVEGRV